MRAVRLTVLICLLSLFLFGCTQAAPVPPTTAPADSTPAPSSSADAPPSSSIVVDAPPIEEPTAIFLCGIDISQMTPEQAFDAVTKGIANYSLTLTANGKTIVVPAAGMKLKLSEDALKQYLKALQEDPSAVPEGLATCDVDAVIKAVRSEFEYSAVNATVTYNSSAKAFVVNKSKAGMGVDTENLDATVAAAVGQLKTAADADIITYYISPKISHTDSAPINAASKANSYLVLDLTYHYEAKGVAAANATISRADLASFLHIDQSSFKVSVSESGIETYISKMSQNHHGSSNYDTFRTSGKYKTDYQVPYYSIIIDTDAMCKDIAYCVENMVSGVRNAPFRAADSSNSRPYGGNYIEVSLDAQKLWVYKNGKCVVKSDIVTGNVKSGDVTPSGLYSVKSKFRDITLKGTDYEQPVDYWVAFIGSSYGFHDATWRYYFGGNIYLTNGSHGCVNMPMSKAKALYENVQVGTAVVVYGSEKSLAKQKITGTAAYVLDRADQSVVLDAAPKYKSKNVTLTYTSSNPDVATVNPDGTVVVGKAGTTTITVKANETNAYTAAQFNVTITVEASAVPPQSSDTPVPDTSDEPVPDTSDEPVPDTSDEPVPDTSDEPVPDTSDEPVPDTSDEPVPDTSDEPVPDTSEKPAPDTSEKPAPDTSEKPAPDTSEKPAPDTSEKPAPDASDEPNAAE